jgi:hypothetical protein
MVARILAECGLYIGESEELVPANRWNPEGHFEHIYFLNLNKRVLRALLGSWNRPPRPFAWRLLRRRLVPLQQEAVELVRRLDRDSPWGWKDPRTSLTLPFWLPLVPGLRVVVCLRNPFAVAGSLTARDGLSMRAGLRLWVAYNRELFRAAPRDRTIVTRYEAYFEDPEREIRALANRLGLSASSASVASAASTVRDDLRSQRPGGHEPLPASVAARYRELLRLAEGNPLGAESSASRSA